jgi:hypothetical protein
VVTWAIVYHVFIPDFMDIYTAQMVEEAASGTPKEIEQTAAQVKQYKELYQSPLLFALMTYAEILPVGLIVSLITAAVLKRKKMTV